MLVITNVIRIQENGLILIWSWADLVWSNVWDQIRISSFLKIQDHNQIGIRSFSKIKIDQHYISLLYKRPISSIENFGIFFEFNNSLSGTKKLNSIIHIGFRNQEFSLSEPHTSQSRSKNINRRNMVKYYFTIIHSHHF